METFRIHFLDEHGVPRHVVVEASSRREAIDVLLAQGDAPPRSRIERTVALY